MEPDWTIIFEILTKYAKENKPINMGEFTRFNEQKVANNMRYLKENGYVEATIADKHDGSFEIGVAVVFEMTAKGYDLLDRIRNDGVSE